MPILRILGKGCGRLIRMLLVKRRKITAMNIALCFPELDAKAQQQLLKRNYDSVGLGLFETALAWFASDKRLQKLTDQVSFDTLYAAMKNNTGVLLMTCHFTMIELGIRLLSMHAPIGVMYRPQNNDLFEWCLQRARRKYVNWNIERYDVRGMLKYLRDDHVICYTPDQDYGADASVFAPFFGIPAATVSGTSRFIKHRHGLVVPGFYYRNANNRYSLYTLPAVENFPSDDPIADATRTNQILEHAIRQHPEQYMWQHRRFKTRPTNAAKIY